MDDLSPEARALLDQVRDLDSPSPQDRARVRAALALHTGAASASAAASTAGKAAPLHGPFSLGLLPKLFLAALALLGATSLALRSHPSSTTSPPLASLPSAPPEPAPGPPTEASAPLASASMEVPYNQAPPDPPPPTTGSTARPLPRPPTSPSARLDHELTLLAEARKAMRDGDSGRALRLLQQHEQLHPGGALAEERAAAQVVALCRAGKTGDARTEAARFLARYPSSPLASRVRAACP